MGLQSDGRPCIKSQGRQCSQAEGDIYARRNPNPFHREARSLKDGEVFKYKNKIHPALGGLFVFRWS